jgi:hypothetical protein
MISPGEMDLMFPPAIDATAWTLLAPPKPPRGTHIIVLAHTHPGSEGLSALLTGHPSLACTAGTGVLQLCEQAASTWRGAERTGSTLSTLAAASVRALTGSLISVFKSQEGRERWCEISAAPARAARTFLQIYPETTVVCLHRNCADVVHAELLSGHGPGGAAEATSFTAAASHWQARAESLLALERDHLGQCLRVRHEDLVTSEAAAAALLSFLGLDQRGPGAGGRGGGCGPVPGWRYTDTPLAGRIAAPVLDQVNRLHAELGYPAISPVRTDG